MTAANKKNRPDQVSPGFQLESVEEVGLIELVNSCTIDVFTIKVVQTHVFLSYFAPRGDFSSVFCWESVSGGGDGLLV